MTQGEPRHLSDEDLLLWQSGELSGGERAWAAAHLKSCAPCSERQHTFGPAANSGHQVRDRTMCTSRATVLINAIQS